MHQLQQVLEKKLILSWFLTSQPAFVALLYLSSGLFFLESARPQALTCQGRGWSAAAAHAKDPARPVLHSLCVRRGFGAKTSNFFKSCVAPPEATPSRFVFRSSRCSSHKPAPRRAT